jgi:hypothetical protein
MGGGGGGSSQFKAQGPPPSFDYQTAQGLQNMAIGGDIQSYALSNEAFANQYPALQQAYQQYQSNIGAQAGTVAQGQQNQGAIMGGLANTIGGRQATPTTSDIQNIQNAAATAGSAVKPIFGLGQSQAGLAQPIANMGLQQGRTGQQLTGLGQQMTGMATTPYQTGLSLLNQPITPQTQQQMMLSGLGQTAGALGGASLGQGMAGQAAAARQLGLGTVQYWQAMRVEAMQDIGQASSMMGAGGQMAGLGASTIGQGAATMGLGGQQLAQGAQTYGLGANTAATAGGLSGAAQSAQEQYGMDTAQMAAIYGGLQGQQATNLMGNIANANQVFPKQTFGLGGTNMANADLSQASAYNSFNQANYATMNGIASNAAQMASQSQQIQAQQSAGMLSAGVGVATSAASIAATAAGAAACWLARAVYGTDDNRWKIFRHWLMNKAPGALRRAYLRYGEALSLSVRSSASLRFILKLLMDRIIERTTYARAY